MRTTLPIGSDEIAAAAGKLRGPQTGGHILQQRTAPVATFGAGCFWTVEAAFAALPGVLETVAGYCGGALENPTFRDVCARDTGHAEVVQVTYDPLITTYGDLLDLFWRIHDPTSAHRQGYDVGPQYRSRIFVHTREQERAARASRERLTLAHAFRRPIITEIETATTFYRAEAYHQQHFAREYLRASGL